MISQKCKDAMEALDLAVKFFNEAQSEHTDAYDAKQAALEKLQTSERLKGEAWTKLCKLIENGE